MSLDNEKTESFPGESRHPLQTPPLRSPPPHTPLCPHIVLSSPAHSKQGSSAAKNTHFLLLQIGRYLRAGARFYLRNHMLRTASTEHAIGHYMFVKREGKWRKKMSGTRGFLNRMNVSTSLIHSNNKILWISTLLPQPLVLTLAG